jgi:hypothetical protein
MKPKLLGKIHLESKAILKYSPILPKFTQLILE